MIDEPILADEPGRVCLLLGNEAIARGAVEAGVGLATGYPGTPASEILDNLFRLASRGGYVCEYGVNEKVALEVAAGAAQVGVRSIVAFKHLGLNVASDALPTLACSGVTAGMVVVTAGDPGNHTSPNEQDHRLFARMAGLPMLEPATPEQARAMTVLAFELSEELGLPVLLRPTTRVSHTRAAVRLGPRRPVQTRGRIVRDPFRFVPLPPNARRALSALPGLLARAEARLAVPPWTTVEGSGARLGVVSLGVAACYVREAVRDLGAGAEVTHLQLASAAPLPAEPCRELVRRCETVLVVEELMPVVEEQVRSLAHDLEGAGRVLGKLTGHLPVQGEYGPDLVRPALRAALGRPAAPPLELAPEPGPLPPRPPVLCAGCPHRASFAAVRLVFDPDETVFVNDIGCYSLGFGEPLGCADFVLCMGSSLTQGSGMARPLAPARTVSFIGDSTFLHSGMTGLLNAVSCGHDLVVVVLDNGTTAMTGHQPHAGIAAERGWGGPSASIEAIVRGLGVEHLFVVDPMDVEATVGAMRAARDLQGVRVVLSRHRCPVDARRLGEAVGRARAFRVVADRCRACESRERGLPCSAEPDRALGTARVLRALASPDAGAYPVAPCSACCPLGVCVPGYTALVAAARLDDAAALVRERNPLPSVCSRVCHAPCEQGCVRAGEGAGQALAANALKRVALDRGRLPAPPRPAVRRDRTVGVVGSGPAGLACADELARRGYPVTIYEAADEPGGMLRRAIPPYRLPREVLERDIDAILGSGVELRTGVALGREVSLSELAERHDAVFLGIGAWLGAGLGVPGDDLDGVTDCLTFLEAHVAEPAPSLEGRRVAVVGGGDAAVDCARVAVRRGARTVTLVYRRTRDEMPAETAEVEAALSEGVELRAGARPLRAEGEVGRLTRLVCVRTEPGPEGEDGRRLPCDLEDGEHEVEADLVVAATGQRLDRAALAGFELALTGAGTIAVDPETCRTSAPGVFAGGDAATGPATVVEAMAAGKRAAYGIDIALARPGEEVPPLAVPPPRAPAPELRDRRPAGGPARALPARRPAELRRLDMGEVVSCLEPEAALIEAGRCFGCSPCAACDVCTRLLGCPAISAGPGGKPTIDEAQCTGCGLCAAFCPARAIVEVAP